MRLADLRAQHALEASTMSKLDPFADSKALTLRTAEPRRSLTKADVFAPLEKRAPAPFDLLATPRRTAAPLSPLSPSRGAELAGGALAATRRALERPALERPADLPCHRVGDPEAETADPRTYVEGFDVHVYCCGHEIELIYENGEECAGQTDGDSVMVEFVFYAHCKHCRSEKHIHEIRPLPRDRWES
jgi:hypothetical protein